MGDLVAQAALQQHQLEVLLQGNMQALAALVLAQGGEVSLSLSVIRRADPSRIEISGDGERVTLRYTEEREGASE